MVAGQTGGLEVVKTALSDVRFGSKADIASGLRRVCFTPFGSATLVSALCQKQTSTYENRVSKIRNSHAAQAQARSTRHRKKSDQYQ